MSQTLDSDGVLLMISPGATRTDQTPQDSELVWPQSGRRVSLSRQAMQIVSQFAVPASAGSVARRMEEVAPGSADTVLAATARLREAGVLCEFAPDAAPSVSRRTGLFGAPVMSIADALRTDASFVVVGAPYDLGATYRPGSRFGPESLRRVSPSVFRVDETRRGMYDVESGTRLLPGVGLADIGDLTASPGTLSQDLRDDLERTVALSTAAGKVPVVLGGDHSLTLPVIDGLAAHHRAIGVLHFDAHHDYGRVRAGSREGVHHGNFLDWVVGNPAVHCVAQFGVRQLTVNEPEPSPKVHRWPGLSATLRTPDEIVAGLPKNLVWHLTFDVDVLDPAVMAATGTVLAGGYQYQQALALLVALCERLPVIGVDVMEYLPGNDEAPGVTVAGLLVRALHQVAARRQRP
jgi:agmatinase